MISPRTVLALSAVGLLGAAALAGSGNPSPDVALVAGQKATGSIQFNGEEDRIAVELVAGSFLTLKVKGDKKAPLVPELDVLGPDGQVQPVDEGLRKNKKTTAIIKKWEVPTTDTYFVTVRGTVAGPTGSWALKTKLKAAPKRPKTPADVTAPGEAHEFKIPAAAGSFLDVVLKAVKGSTVTPRVLRILDPDGLELDLADPAVRRKEKANLQQLKKIPLPKFGTYCVFVGGDADSVGGYTALFKLKGPKAPKLVPDFTGVSLRPPSLSGADPDNIVVPEAGNTVQAVTVSGLNFLDRDTLTLEAHGGVTLSNVVCVNATTFTCTVTVQTGAAETRLDFSVTQRVEDGGRTAVLPDALKLGPPDPIDPDDLDVTRVVPATGPPEGGGRVTVYGTGFRAGATVEFGSQTALVAKRINSTTIVCVVPPRPEPANANATTLSRTAQTLVNVKVNSETAGGSPVSSTLGGGFAYEKDESFLIVQEVFPPLDSPGNPVNLKSAVMRLSTPANTQTLVAGSSGDGSTSFWFRSGGSQVSQQRIGFGADPRFLVFSRNSTSNLAGGVRYVLDVGIALKSRSGAALIPERLVGTGVHDQWRFDTGAGTDNTAPTLTSISPGDGSTAVSRLTPVELEFSEEIDPLSVTSVTVGLSAGGIGIPVQIRMGDDVRSIVLTPFAELDHTTLHTVTVSDVKDLSGNALPQTTRTFTTNIETDTTLPTVDAVVFDDIRSDMDGSGTYVSGNDSDNLGNPLAAGASQAYDVYYPRAGWQMTVTFHDVGGAGVDETTFSARASTTVGASGAGTDLADKFDVSSTRAVWRVGAGEPFGGAGGSVDNVTVTFSIDDTSGNTAVDHVVTFDVVDRNAAAQLGGDLDPFDARQTWVLQENVDKYTATLSANGTTQQVTTTGSSNGTADLSEALRISGLQTTSMTAAAATTVNGSSTGTNDVVKRLFMERLKALLFARYGIDEDGTHTGDDPNVEFILENEQGSLAALPVLSTSVSGFSAKAFSEMDVGGDTGPNNSPTAAFGTVGQAFNDTRNRNQEANLNSALAAGNNAGIYCINIFKFSGNSSATLSEWGARILAKFQTAKGGVPVGEGALDHIVLAGTFSRSAGGNTQAQNDRYDDVFGAVEASALSVSGVTAHEIGHSTGLVPDGRPKTGLFGNAHRTNTFTEATSGSPNTSGHLDYVGNEIMAPSSAVDDRLDTGSDFQGFNPYNDGYLRHRQVHDEGK